MMYNCPNCGAPINRASDICDYCGTHIGWIPKANIYFVPKQYDKSVLEARATIDLDHIAVYPELEGRIKHELALKMADQIPDVWDVKVDDDPILFRRLYIARLPVWKEKAMVCYG